MQAAMAGSGVIADICLLSLSSERKRAVEDLSFKSLVRMDSQLRKKDATQSPGMDDWTS